MDLLRKMKAILKLLIAWDNFVCFVLLVVDRQAVCFLFVIGNFEEEKSLQSGWGYRGLIGLQKHTIFFFALSHLIVFDNYHKHCKQALQAWHI